MVPNIEPTRVLNPNSISIGSAIFAGLMIVTDQQTDHATSVTIGCIYVGYLVLRCGLIIPMSVFMVLSLWHGHCDSSLGSSDECRLCDSLQVATYLIPSQTTWDVSLPLACYHPLSPSPFVVIIRHESWYSFTHFKIELAATLRGSRPGVQSASLIMTSLMMS